MTILIGDCLDRMAAMDADSVDAIVTDPPYGIGFMGKTWDHEANVAFEDETWAAALRVAKPGAYLAAFGSPRQFHRLMLAIEEGGWILQDTLCWLHGQGFPKGKAQLKPAFEPIVLARKKGPAVLNIDDCRLSADGNMTRVRTVGDRSREQYRTGTTVGGPIPTDQGRWPANVILDEDAAALLDTTVGPKGGNPVAAKGKEPRSYRIDNKVYSPLDMDRKPFDYGDTGGPSRFFYTAKASKAERGEGNDHPTVKPLALMRWLIRLVTPEGGLVLDPFTGSGTTGCAAVLEGRRFVGVELSDEYAEIARRRVAHHTMPLFAEEAA